MDSVKAEMPSPQAEQTAIDALVNHEPTRESDGPFRAVEKATGLVTVEVRQLVEDLVRRGLVHREAIVTDSFSSDDQRWCWKSGPLL